MPFTDAQKKEILELKEHFENYMKFVSGKANLLKGLLGASSDIVIAGGVFATLRQLLWTLDMYPNKPLHEISEKVNPVNDIDVFFLNTTPNSSVHYSWQRYFLEMAEKQLVYSKPSKRGYEKNPHILAVYEENVVLDPQKNTSVKVQYIITSYGTREDLISEFDFKHCTMNYHDKKLYVTEAAYDAANRMKLVPNNDKFPPASWRIDKFKSRGYTMNENPYKEVIRDSMKATIKTFFHERFFDPLAKLPE